MIGKRLIMIIFVTYVLLAGGDAMALTIKSAAFENGGMIPAEYTCKGADVSPALTWGDVPERTKSFALICDDPDAPMGTWVHWVVYDIPQNATGLSKGVKRDDVLHIMDVFG